MTCDHQYDTPTVNGFIHKNFCKNSVATRIAPNTDGYTSQEFLSHWGLNHHHLQ